MTDWAYAAFVAFLVVQLPLAVLVYIDARRLGLKEPFVWEVGVLVPAAGVPIVLYYLSNRKTLPKKERPRHEPSEVAAFGSAFTRRGPLVHRVRLSFRVSQKDFGIYITSGTDRVIVAPTLFQNPLFRWGIALLDAIVIAAIAIVFIEDRTLQLLLFAVAAVGLVVTPMVLKRAAMEA